MLSKGQKEDCSSLFTVNIVHTIYIILALKREGEGHEKTSQLCQTPKVGTYVVLSPLLELPIYLAHREWLGREQLRNLTASLTNTNDNSSTEFQLLLLTFDLVNERTQN